MCYDIYCRVQLVLVLSMRARKSGCSAHLALLFCMYLGFSEITSLILGKPFQKRKKMEKQQLDHEL